jgi:hypothetical protein
MVEKVKQKRKEKVGTEKEKKIIGKNTNGRAQSGDGMSGASLPCHSEYTPVGVRHSAPRAMVLFVDCTRSGPNIRETHFLREQF